MRKCGNCKNRCFAGYYSLEYCERYELAKPEEEEEIAKDCDMYEYGTPDCYEEEHTPSATNGDYSPSSPWDAPGMSIHDFI